MNTHSTPSGRVARTILAAMLLPLGLAGCWEKRVIWSPDGERAVVLAQEGQLRLCDADGGLTTVLASNVRRAAWLGDSERLVLARTRTVATWDDLAAALPAPRVAALVAEAEAVLQRLQGGAPWGVVMLFGGQEKSALQLCLRDTLGEKFKSAAPDAWAGSRDTSVDLGELVMARISSGGDLELMDRVFADLEEIAELRPSPRNEYVACVTDPPRGKTRNLYVVALAGGAAPKLVAENVAAYPDWSADGRSLVYAQAAGGPGPDDLSLGAIVRREVVRDDGSLAVSKKGEDLAGIMFSELTRIRCLRDGRILFNATEFLLPVATRDLEGHREQLFAIDAGRQATLVRMIPRKSEEHLPQILAFFEVSPDETQVVVGNWEGFTSILTLASGEVVKVQDPDKDTDFQSAVVWRRAGEICYVRRTALPKDGSAAPTRPAEVVLRRGEEESVLSRTWPDDVLESVIAKGGH